jgi:tetraacyldisaccharide 4'-kinase
VKLTVKLQNYIYKKAEEYLFFPTIPQLLIALSLLPMTLLYCAIVTTKRFISKEEKMGIDVVSIGNLILGGSGKTPFVIELCKNIENSAVVLRGYKRKSKGVVVISLDGKVLEDINISGDEAMLFTQSIKNSTVIVSEDRKKGIKKAKELGKKIVFLDDGFSKFNIKKIDILLKPAIEPTNIFCLPSGGYKEPKRLYKKAHFVLQDDVDFKRVVTLPDIDKDSILITAISKPKRVKKYIGDIEHIFFPDHYRYKKDEIAHILKEHNKTNIITTSKDYVKLKDFGFDVRVLNMSIEIKESIKKDILKKITPKY